MKVYSLQSSTKIIKVLYDYEVFGADLSTMSPYNILEIDEILPDNQAICQDLARTINKVDLNGDGKYYVENGELYEREGWEEYMDGAI